jgi:hypothetical protein
VEEEEKDFNRVLMGMRWGINILKLMEGVINITYLQVPRNGLAMLVMLIPKWEYRHSQVHSHQVKQAHTDTQHHIKVVYHRLVVAE